MRPRHPHTGAPPAVSFATFSAPDSSKKRGSYNCGRCGQPKKGHVCHLPPSEEASVTHSLSPPPPTPLPNKPRRALSFDEVDFSSQNDVIDEEISLFVPILPEINISGGLPVNCVWEVMRRLPPADLLSAAKVCRDWRLVSRKVWRAAEELRLRVPRTAPVGSVGSVLNKCPMLTKLSLTMKSDVDATMLACIAFSCPSLEHVEISMSDGANNRISGDELGRFVADKRCLKGFKMEGCLNLGGFVLCSSSLSTLWLSDLYSLSKMVFNCPNLRELSLDFSRLENDTTDLIAMVDSLGRGCLRLQNIHIASALLSHSVVLALTSAELRGLRMLSLVLGSEITDASVASIASTYSRLELLDLSGSSITDSGIGMICNVFPETLSRLLVALCPNVTSSGIQFASAQLPLLELMDCGMSVCDPNSDSPGSEEFDDYKLPITSNNKQLQLIYQKLIIKHSRLRKLSLWGCSGLDSLYLNCPELNDLNLTSCRNLHPDRLLLQCPKLETLHASGCPDLLLGAIQTQVHSESDVPGNHFQSKRMADGSKRVRVPHFLNQQSLNYDEEKNRGLKRRCMVHINSEE